MKNKETLYCSKIIKEQHNFIIKDVSPSNKLDIGGTIKILQQEQDKNKYSEDEVLELWNWLNDGFMMRKSLPTREELIGWFEQIKKK
jgi:hypothetical protein